jgi:hypothetical protein
MGRLIRIAQIATKHLRGGSEVRRSPEPHGGGFASLAGVWRGRVKIADDFDDLPDDLAKSFGVRQH